VQAIRQFVLEFVSPLALNYGHQLLAAAAHVWSERRHKSPSVTAKRVRLLVLMVLFNRLLHSVIVTLFEMIFTIVSC